MIDKNDLVDLGRTPIESQWHSLKLKADGAPPLYNDSGLNSQDIWQWIVHNLGNVWHTRFSPYPAYSDPANNNGIFEIQKDPAESVSIALVADWASNTIESHTIATQMGINDYSIHLGDTYYVGSSEEISENFDPDNNGPWPYGNLGSFALAGNHEMYSGGESFYTELLPMMGTYEAGNDDPVQVQQSGFFCLENAYWRIIGLDTGYDSLTGIADSDNTNLDLTDEQKDWLTNAVNLNGDNRGIIFLSHHQCISGFENNYPNPMNFISGLMNPARNIVWLAGHEHWFSVYGPNALPNGANIYYRCIGNGGMPVELFTDNAGIKKPKDPNNVHNPVNCNLVLFDQRQREVLPNGVKLGHNGYVILQLEQNNAVISYYDDNNLTGAGRKILEESWTVDTGTGELKGTGIKDLTNFFGADLMQQLSLFGDNINDAQ